VEARGLKTVRSDWSNTILVCKKCSKKLGGGFGPKGKTGLAKALRSEFGGRKGRKGAAGIIDVKCLGVCPRGSVTVVNGAAPGEWLLVREGLPIAAVAAELGLGAAPNESLAPDAISPD
jgi:predicted metal-binding protein